jgi:hypothetical protein
MAEYTYDGSQDPEFIASLEAEQADSERIGGELMDAEQGLLAGKFQSAADLERGYLELQQLLGKKGAPAPEADEPTEEEPTEEPTEEDEEVDVAAYLADEFATNGELSAETLEQLSQFDAGSVAQLLLAAGVTEQAQPLSEDDQLQLQGIVGTPAEYGQMISWAKDNVPQPEIDAFNQVINRGNPESVYFAIQALNGRYRAEAGYEGRLIDKTRPPAGKGDVFRSQAEVQRAMNDPRYDTDEAYRTDVFNKIERSTGLEY